MEIEQVDRVTRAVGAQGGELVGSALVIAREVEKSHRMYVSGPFRVRIHFPHDTRLMPLALIRRVVLGGVSRWWIGRQR